MDIARQERLARLNQQLEALPQPTIESLEELARIEQARASRHFGFTQPEFRTSVKVRFSGDGVQGNDLNGATAGGVVAEFTGAVGAAGAQLSLPPHAADLFLSPNVGAGSTVLELFGRPLEAPERLDIDIDDSPVDAAIARVLKVLTDANSLVARPGGMPRIGSALGKRLFSLSRHVLDGDVDLGIAWTRPRGATRSVQFSRATARILRDVLDVEESYERRRTHTGTLDSISTSGLIGFTPNGKRKPLLISVDGFDLEAFRGLWATEVVATWTEKTISHPQRGTKSVTNHLTSLNPLGAPDDPAQDGDTP
jgi:hypothetical protein